MKKIKMLRNLLGVQKLEKASQRSSNDIFADTESDFSTGMIAFVGEAVKGPFQVGQKVYIGTKREQIRMDGRDIMVMEEDNVYAIIED